jgi:SAM-dependent methyltransferase
VLTRLDRIVPAAPGRPEVAGADHPMRVVTVEVAAGGGWGPERARDVSALFDRMASGWSARVAGEADAPLGDALARGGVASGGRCIEVGSGSGVVTSLLARPFDEVLCIDLSAEMLHHAPPSPGWRVQADGAHLPLPSGSVDVVALVNAFLFPLEVARVLRPAGAVLWVSTLGDRTPIYLPPDVVLDRLPGEWDGLSSLAGWGEWLVARRR